MTDGDDDFADLLAKTMTFHLKTTEDQNLEEMLHDVVVDDDTSVADTDAAAVVDVFDIQVVEIVMVQSETDPILDLDFDFHSIDVKHLHSSRLVYDVL